MYTLRPAVRADAPIIRQIVRQAQINPTGLNWQRFIVAVADHGEVIGCAQIKPHADGTHELASLAVVGNWQNRGVARALLEYLLARHPQMLYLMCRAGLIPLYIRFGFTVLNPDEMPAYYRRIATLFHWMRYFFRRSQGLAIMRRLAQVSSQAG